MAGPMILANKLVELIDAEELTPAQAEKLAGHLLLSATGRPSPVSRRTSFRRRAELREHGLVLSDGVLQEVEVNLGEVLESVLDSDAWERQG